MAARSVSPGAALLRASRMFSMPNPIAASPGDYSSATKHHSGTSTIPYPTHLTVTTPSTSRINGDWGFKRPLPLKTTTKQTFPLVRIRQVDSMEHVTDFQSASDHTMTLKKFQELNLPISVPVARSIDRDLLARHPKSVFEEDGDVTAIEPEQAQSIENKRWKFKGPWLAGMTDGEFSKWLEKKVRTRRAEFRDYLKETYAKELTEEQTSQAIRDELPVPPEVSASHITEIQFIDYLRDLREDRLVLFRHVGRFLDLAPLSTESKFISTMKPNRAQQFDKENPYGTKGPPITHPSAGLSYLRTANFTDNHPIYGPQKYHPPVKARVLKPRNPNAGVHEPALGVAGFVAHRPTDQRVLGFSYNSPRAVALSRLELERHGGAKLFYKLDSATVDSSGKINISISDPGNSMAELVVKELLGEDSEESDVYADSMLSSATPEIPRNPRSHRIPPTTHIYGSRESYGLGGDQSRSI
ncbi:mitochondrial ribosomal protein MRP51 [Nemania diffusa]|nr:mitochondrial ribosomal protein MRP51 [Nemania diffusa]